MQKRVHIPYTNIPRFIFFLVLLGILNVLQNKFSFNFSYPASSIVLVLPDVPSLASGWKFSFPSARDLARKPPIPFCHSGVGLMQTGLHPAYLFLPAKVNRQREVQTKMISFFP